MLKDHIYDGLALVNLKDVLYYYSVVIEHGYSVFARHQGAKTFLNCDPYEFRFFIKKVAVRSGFFVKRGYIHLV